MAFGEKIPPFCLPESDSGIELLPERTSLFKAQATERHPFVEEDPEDYRPLFHDRQIRDDFDAGLEQLKRSGRYQQIYDHYLQQ